MNIINGITLVVLFLLQSVDCLYEDQIKKFDWRDLHIGKLRTAHLDLSSQVSRLIVTTSDNVLASLSVKNGDIHWRQIFEKGSRGNIKYSHYMNEQAQDTTAVKRASNHGYDMITVQGAAPALVRGWNTARGNIVWEWSLIPTQPEKAESAFWFYSNTVLHHVVPAFGSHLEVTRYYPSSGQLVDSTTSKVTAPWIDIEKCISSGVYYVCVEGHQSISIDLTAEVPKIIQKQLPIMPKSKLESLKGVEGVVIIEGTLVSIEESLNVCELSNGTSYLQVPFNNDVILFKANLEDAQLTITAYNAKTCERVKELDSSVVYPKSYGTPELQSFNCKNVHSDGKGCAFVLSTDDEAILFIYQNKIRWIREESLANILAVEFIDMPLADTEGTIESELKSSPGSIFGAFLRRITAQSILIKSMMLHVLGLGPPPTDTQRAGLIRDSFGLHKMLVVLTKCGKIFGIDNVSGRKHWMQYLPMLDGFDNEQNMRLIVQRTSKHFVLPPICAVVAKDAITKNGIIYRFNPITGKSVDEGPIKLNFEIMQLTVLKETENDFIRGILLLGSNYEIHVIPKSTEEMAKGMYLFTANKITSTLNGFYVRTGRHGHLEAQPTWSVRLGGHHNEHKIVAVALKNPIERVHSQGRVLSDRSVLYKYVNPNLVAVATIAVDNIHRYIMNLHLIDVVSGFIVFSMAHRKARGPLHIVHSENWLAYSYFNDKVRRTEITTIELYEGKTQANSTVWSSLDAPTMPLVERQSYIIPTLVEALKETITERGITNKHVLIGTSSGAIIEMSWALLDPRRPITAPNQAREEGVIPYIPELPLPTENIINYNQTVARIRNIYTAPSRLESTCLVVATGLDLFVTRVSPSKTFDLLKENFDYFLITIVLLALTTSSLVLRYLSSRKLLKDTWK